MTEHLTEGLHIGGKARFTLERREWRATEAELGRVFDELEPIFLPQTNLARHLPQFIHERRSVSASEASSYQAAIISMRNRMISAKR
jgi:hypothetical protein